MLDLFYIRIDDLDNMEMVVSRHGLILVSQASGFFHDFTDKNGRHSRNNSDVFKSEKKEYSLDGTGFYNRFWTIGQKEENLINLPPKWNQMLLMHWIVFFLKFS